MVTRDEILTLLSTLKNDLSTRYKVRRIGIFGSYARSEAVPGSDVDILVDFNPGADFFDLIDLSTVPGREDREKGGPRDPACTQTRGAGACAS